MKETEYIELFVASPIWSDNKWTAWTSMLPIEGGYKVRIPVPEHLLIKKLEDAEIINHDT